MQHDVRASPDLGAISLRLVASRGIDGHLLHMLTLVASVRSSTLKETPPEIQNIDRTPTSFVLRLQVCASVLGFLRAWEPEFIKGRYGINEMREARRHRHSLSTLLRFATRDRQLQAGLPFRAGDWVRATWVTHAHSRQAFMERCTSSTTSSASTHTASCPWTTSTPFPNTSSRHWERASLSGNCFFLRDSNRAEVEPREGETMVQAHAVQVAHAYLAVRCRAG